MKRLENDMLTTENTYITYDENYNYAPTKFEIRSIHDDKVLCVINFQDKPVSEGLNGPFMEDLLGICLFRLETFRIDNCLAIVGIQDALKGLRSRTNDRKSRGVQGTYNK